MDVAQRRDSAPKQRSPRVKGRRCEATRSRLLQEEIGKQVAQAAQEIVRANVDKAKAGSLAHTRWLCSLMERETAEERIPASAAPTSLAEILLQQLKSQQ